VNHYLYAIVDRMPAAWRPPTCGLGNASVVPRRVDDIVLLGSFLETVPAASPRTRAIHHEIVATALDAAALVPLRYGTAVPATGLADWFAAHRAVIDAALDAVRDCVEMSIKLLRLDGTLAARGDDGLEARQLQALADALVDRAALTQWRYRPSGVGGNVAASIAFLVPRPELPTFLARIAPVASHATGVAVVPTGPWPPYSFVPDFDRAPLARVTREGDTAGRRAG